MSIRLLLALRVASGVSGCRSPVPPEEQITPAGAHANAQCERLTTVGKSVGWRPAARSRRRIEARGPQITQAGLRNYRSTSLAEGFQHHPDAWRERAVKFYAHPVPP